MVTAARGLACVEPVMDPVYLPISEKDLRCHFALASGSEDDRDYTAYYRESLQRRAEYEQAISVGRPPKCSVRVARQVEKDERFWTAAALSTLYHTSGGPDARIAFASLM